MTTKPVRVRFAPSPTGSLHIGGARTALFNWLFARANDGQFILRIEDTDRSRFVEGAIEEITTGLRWLGLEWDEGPDKGGDYGPYVQSERLERYQKWAHWLVEQGKAYKDYSTKEELEHAREIKRKTGGGKVAGYERLHRFLTDEEREQLEAERGSYVIRLAMPMTGETIIEDAIHGKLKFPNEDLSDIVLLKSDGFPTYHLAMAVDDHFMEISHVMRSDEWVSSAPMHHNLYQALEWDAPTFVHLPIMTHNGKKISKRKPPKTDKGEPIPIYVREYQALGFQPEAVVNWLSNIGWTFGDDVEIFSTDQSLERFSLERISHSPTEMPFSKLQHLNGHYIREMDLETLGGYIRPMLVEAYGDIDDTIFDAILPHLQERINPIQEAVPMVGFLFQDDFTPPTVEQLIPKKLDADTTKLILEKVIETLAALPDFETETQEPALRGLVKELDLKVGQVFNTIRIATTNQRVSPPLFPSLYALGRDNTLERLRLALAQFDN